MDGSKHIPVAITTKTVSGEKKMVKILSGITEAKIVPEGSSLKVLANNWVDLLTVDKNLEGRALWDNLGLSDAGQDLDHLLLARDSLGGDGNWNVLGAVHEENVLAVVDLVGEGHVVEGANN